MKKYVLLLVVLLAIGCSSRINKAMNAWVGAPIGDVIASWGPPSSAYDDGYGGKVYVWEYENSVTMPGTATTNTTGSATRTGNTAYGSATSQTTYDPPRTYSSQSYRMFFANADGIVYRWSWRGY